MFRNLSKTCLRLCGINQLTNFTLKRYAGHSKWQNIRHIKGTKDAQRSALFTKLSRQMKVAVAEGGSTNPKLNLKLENMIEQAKRANMPQATIQSILKSCESDKSNSKPYLLEIKGPGGCIILCEVYTGAFHQLKMTISTILRKHQCKYSDGGGMYLFEEKGIIIANPPEDKSPDELEDTAIEHAIESGAEDVEVTENEDGKLEFTCGATNLRSVTSALEKFNYKISSASVEFLPLKLQELTDSDLQLCASLYEKLESLPEVVRLSDNVA